MTDETKKMNDILGDLTDKPVPLKELKFFPFEEIQRMARDRGIAIIGKTRQELELILSGESDTGGHVYDRREIYGLSREDVREMEDKMQNIPDKTILPADPNKRRPWEQIIEKNPMAFNGVDLTDDTGPIVHHLDSERDAGKVYCACGREVAAPRYDDKGNWIPLIMCPGVGKPYMDLGTKKTMMRPMCINEREFRKHIFHRVPVHA